MLRKLRRITSGKNPSNTFLKVSNKELKLSPNYTRFNVRAKSAAGKYFTRLIYSQNHAKCAKPSTLRVSALTRSWGNSILLLPGRSTRGSLVPRSKLSRSRFFINLNKSLTGRRIYTSLRKFYPVKFSNTRLLGSRLPFLGTKSAYMLSQLIESNWPRKLSRKRAIGARKLYDPRRISSNFNSYVGNSNRPKKPFSLNWSIKTPLTLLPILEQHNVHSYVWERYVNFPDALSPLNLLIYLPFRRPVFKLIRGSTLSFGNSWLPAWVRFTSLYTHFGFAPRAEIYLQVRKAKRLTVTHDLYMRFNKHRLIIALADEKKCNTHFFLSTGLLLKHFQRKKSIKKNKSMKLLMARFLRKLLILLRLRNIILRIRGVPLYLDIMLAMLFRPLSHFFTDPFTGQEIDEIQKKKTRLNFSAIVFTRFKPFGYQKEKKMGRVKRKIRRKLVKLNAVID